MSKHFGIDLGTTNSAISVVTSKSGDTSEIIKLSNGKTTLPSCVMYEYGEFIAGDLAYNNRWKTNVVYSSKRFMGSDKTYTLAPGITLTSIDVARHIISTLAKEAEQAGYGKVENVTITVPAYFNDKQRNATMEAGRQAGLNVVAIINEPTSASLAYGLGKSDLTKKILVYDLGGGTFDVTLLDIVRDDGSIQFPLLGITEGSNGVSVKVRANAGDTKLGGDDIDDNLLKIALSKLPKDAPQPNLEKLKLQLEKAKKTGTSLTSTTIKLDNGLTVLLKLDDFIEAIKPVWERTLTNIKDCLRLAQDKEFHEIALVGGSTKSTIIQDYLRKEFPDKKIYTGLNPDEAVALGASIMTGISMGDSVNTIFDVIPLPIGIKVSKKIGSDWREGYFNPIINKDEPIPTKRTHVITTVKDNQDAISLEIYQGTKMFANENILLGQITLDNLPPAKAGELDIYIQMFVGVNGTLTVTATVLGKEYNLTIEDKPQQQDQPVLDHPQAKKISRIRRGLKTLPVEVQSELSAMLDKFEQNVITNKEFTEYYKTVVTTS